jgi:hypothetical protein
LKKEEEENKKRGSIKSKPDETDDEKDELEEDIEVTHF